ncbi:MAG: hypothetical protein J5769_00935 [Bacteroidales bacterium]|nr:hypothetical protein [Bacteroidales bacterium]
MKKASLLLLAAALCLCACQPSGEENDKDKTLTGEKVPVDVDLHGVNKVFLLNEGQMGSNNATLDFLRLADGNYITGAFKKMNPDEGGGLGDVGNDIAIKGNEAWIVVNNSGIVEVISARDETHIAAIPVPTPRNIAFDDKYAYVSSWAGAYVTGSYDESFNYVITDSKNPKGQVYRIDLKTKKVDGSVEVGYQPEGLAYYEGKLYVANSGGVSCQLPPDYAYDNTVSVIDCASFKVEHTIAVAPNLKSVFASTDGRIYVTTMGNYYDVHSGLYVIEGTKAGKVADYVSVASICADVVFCIGAENEFDWNSPGEYFAWSCKAGKQTFHNFNFQGIVKPYGLLVPDSADFTADVFIADAGDYFNPGTLHYYRGVEHKWSVTTGVCPAHFAIW